MQGFRQKHAYDALFPFVLMYHEKRDPRTEPDLHFHDWYELVYIYSGKGSFFIHQEFYPMQPGDLFILPGNVLHRAIPDPEEAYTVSVVLFDPVLLQHAPLGDSLSGLSAFALASEGRFHLPLDNPGVQSALERGLAEIHRELQEKAPGYRHAALSLFQWLAVTVARIPQAAADHSSAVVSRSRLWMKEILAYIDTHLTAGLSLTHLAKQALVSPEHFSRVFKQMTGYSLPEYLNARKIMAAKDMLLHSALPVAEVGQRAGFASTSHFHRLFKACLGCTPAEYRQKAQDIR